MPRIPDKPALSNRLSDLAERAGEAARRYRRGSIESIQAYLDAGELLAEARGECRRGEWGAVLERAGIADRTGRLMVQCWRIAKQADADAERIHEAGGVQAFVAAAVDAAKEALHRAADGLDDGAGEDEGADEKPALSAGFEGDEGETEGGEKPALNAGFENDDGETEIGEKPDSPGLERVPREVPPGAESFRERLANPDGLSDAQRRRQAKRDAGICIDCSRPTDGWHVRCPACRERISAAGKRQRENAKLGAVLGKRIREAARTGKGIRLTAEDVAGLVDGQRSRFRERLARGGASKGHTRGSSGASR